MPSFPRTTKETIYPAGKGMNQLGEAIGKPLPGDVAKVHLKASFVADRPMFRWGSLKIGKEIPRQKEFLSTHIVGDTAFFEVRVGGSEKKVCSSFLDILAMCVEQMALGETSVFSFELDEKLHHLFTTKLHKGHYENLPDNAKSIILEIDSFRIVRNKSEHFRPNRNGTGASMPGSFSMG